MHIKEIRAFEGPNIYSNRPVIKMLLELGDYRDIPTKDIPGLNAGILSLLPGLSEHHCSLGVPGGFLKRLYEGTYIAHVCEHTALEILTATGQEVSFGKARQVKGSLYEVVFEYLLKSPAMMAAKLSADLIESYITGNSLDFEARLQEIRRKTREGQLGPSTAAIVEEAKSRGIPVTRIGGESFVILGYGKSQRRIRAAMTQNTGCIAAELATDKSTTKELLAISGIPVPRGIVARTREEAAKGAKEVGFPVVVKPRDANQGKGVSLGLWSEAEVERAFDIARVFSSDVLVEEFISGKHYRMLVAGGKFLCAARRIPARVIGDGTSCVLELVERTNSDPLRGDCHEKPLTKIKIDDVAKEVLAKQGFSLDYIAPKGTEVLLRENDNLSTGGEAWDVTSRVCPENKRLAERVSKIIGLDIAGIDITTEDISIPVAESSGAVIEVNAAPGLRMHLYPSRGEVRPVASDVVDYMYPDGIPQMPIIAVTGTNGKTTTVRMLSKILSFAGYNTGFTCTDGIYIGAETIKKGDCSGPESAMTVLLDPQVDAAVLEIARGGILRAGLAYDRADVGIITNITSDHLGIGGVKDLEDLAFVKSIVAEQVKPGGYSVMNADDPVSMKIIDRASGNVILFSAGSDNLIIRGHLSRGGKAVYVKNGLIYLEGQDGAKPLIKVREMPSTLKGMARHNLYNALAAVGGAWGLGIVAKTIAKALKGFAGDGEDNPGRLNFFEIRGIKVLVDYGHNVAGFEAIISTAKRLKPGRLIGVIASPSDRRDEDIVSLGKVAGAGFWKLIIKEDENLRGRGSGETAELLLQGALSSGMKRERIEVVLKEDEAVMRAAQTANPGELIVVFYENYDNVLKTLKNLREMKAEPEGDYAPAGAAKI